MTTPITQTITAELVLCANAETSRDPAERGALYDIDLNEFTVNGKGWSEADIRDYLTKRRVSDPGWRATVIWRFLDMVAADAADPDAWEDG
jgi:hypothetical protein